VLNPQRFKNKEPKYMQCKFYFLADPHSITVIR